MRVDIEAGFLRGKTEAPPSKSMAHRALICAYLSGEPCEIKNIAYSDDIRATIGALRALGASITESGDTVTVNTGGVVTDRLDCNESGSTLRFMIPLCLLTGRRIELFGTKRLFSRSLSVYEKLCHERGFEYTQTENSLTVCGMLTPGTFHVRGDISSQFISGLMFALPCLDKDSIIKADGKFESMPYIEMTRDTLKSYGVHTAVSDTEIKIPGNCRFRPQSLCNEGDWSNAAFFLAMNTLGHSVTVLGLNPESTQGDRICTEYLKRIAHGTPELDVSDCPDLAPILMAVMAAENGGTLIGTHRLKIKESDRGAAMAAELAKFGAHVTVNENSITVSSGIKKPTELLCGHNDHRIVMALSVLCTLTGGSIDGASAINKSMPDFFDKLETLGAKIRRINKDEA